MTLRCPYCKFYRKAWIVRPVNTAEKVVKCSWCQTCLKAFSNRADMKPKPRIIWAIVSVYNFDGRSVCWGNYKTRAEARHACNGDETSVVRKSRVVKFMEVL